MGLNASPPCSVVLDGGRLTETQFAANQEVGVQVLTKRWVILGLVAVAVVVVVLVIVYSGGGGTGGSGY